MLKYSLRAAAVLLAAAALLGSAPVVPAPAADPVAVVVHPQNPVRTMSFDQLRRVFLAQQQFWPGRARINLLVNAPQQPERAVVLRRIFSMSEDQYRQFWIAKVFRAEVPSAPATARSSDEVRRAVLATPGTIGFLRLSEVGSEVRVLRIDGKYPGEAGYPLQ